MTYMPYGGERTLNCVHEWEVVADSWPPGSTDPDPDVELYCPRCKFRKFGKRSDETPKRRPDPPEVRQGITVGTDVRDHWYETEGAYWRAGVKASRSTDRENLKGTTMETKYVQYFNGGPADGQSRQMLGEIRERAGMPVDKGVAVYHLRWVEGRRVQGPAGYEYDWRGEYI